MKTLACNCPKCEKTNTFNVENSIQEQDVEWFQCSFCWERPTKSDWLKGFAEGPQSD